MHVKFVPFQVVSSFAVFITHITDKLFHKEACIVFRFLSIPPFLFSAQCAVCTVGSPCVQNPPVYDTGDNRIVMYLDRDLGKKRQNPVVATGV